MSLNELARQALLGSRNDAGSAPVTGHPDAESLAARLMVQGAPGATLLRQAALLTLAARAGYVPERPNLPPAEPCPEDARPVLPERAATIVQRVLSGFLPQLAGPLLDETTRRGLRLPAGLLPALLELGRKAEHRERVPVVACRKAYWLAAQNSDWRYLADPDRAEPVFETGGPSERRMALRALRKADAGAARESLANGWSQEPPNERAGLIEALDEGLSDADEDFLENALNDRRKEVRKAAAALLARLPDSRLVARMRERLRPCLKFKKSLLSTTLDVELPADCDQTMARDGIEKKNNIYGLGERAAWLAQMLACVPPSEWCREFGLSEAKLLKLFRSHEFSAALDYGLASAMANFRDCGLARTWLESALERNDARPEIFNRVVWVLQGSEHLPALAMHALRRDHDAELETFLRLSPTPWTDALGKACLQVWRDPAWQRRQAPYGSRLRAYLSLAQVHLPPRPEYTLGWDTLANELHPAVRQAVDEFIQAMELRIQFNQALETP